MQEFWQYALDFGWVQWLAVMFNILYVIYAAREHIWCWIFGLIGVSLLFVIYIEVNLYSDALLQVFYVIMSIYGWISWQKGEVMQRSITRYPVSKHFGLLVIGSIGAGILGYLWQQFGAALPYIDACTTSFSIIATFLVAKKVLENWIYWIVIDLVCIGVYWVRDIPLISVLFLVYSALAVMGLISWRKRWESALKHA